jgi:hypothetical protein
MQHLVAHAWITVLSCRSRNISKEGRNRLRRSKKVSCKHWGFWHRHTRDSQGWQHCVVIPLAKRITGTTEKFEKAKECVVPSQRSKEDEQRLDRFYVIICKNAKLLQVQFIIHFLSVSSGFHFHTHAFPSLLRVFYALRTVHVTPVTSHQLAPHHGYNAVAGECGAGSNLLCTNRHSLPTK